MTDWLNRQPFRFVSSNGTIFTCDRSDFAAPLRIEKPCWMSEAQFLQDYAEMISTHRADFWPKLNGFAGYDTLRFEFVGRGELTPPSR